MRYAKPFLTVLIIAFGVLFSCEAYQLQLTSISEKHYFLFTGIDDADREGFQYRFLKIQSLLEEEKLDYYIVNTSPEGKATHYTVYCGEHVRSLLIEAGYREGKYFSFFSGEKSFSYKDWDSYLHREVIDSTTDTIYVIGFSPDLIVSNYLKEKVFQGEERRSYLAIIRTVWVLLFVALLLLTVMGCNLRRKEWMVKVIYGFSPSKLCCGIILRDAAFLLLLVISFGAFFFRLGFFQACSDFLPVYLGIHIILNSGIIIWNFCHFEYKRAFSRDVSSNKLLKLNYVSRGIILCTTVLFFSLMVGQGKIVVSMLKQKKYYEQFKGYYHVLMYSTYGESGSEVGLPKEIKMNNAIYRDKMKEWGIVVLSSEGFLGVDFISANINAKRLIISEIPSIDNKLNNNRIYILVPMLEKEWNNKLKVLKSFVENRWGKKGSDCEVIVYSEESCFRAFKGMGDEYQTDIILKREPIILLNTFESVDDAQVMNSHIAQNFLMFAVKAEPSQMRLIAREKGFENIRFVEIYEMFHTRVSAILKRLFAMCVVLILCVAIEIILLTSSIQMEIEMNSMQICVAKIHGCPLFQRYRQIIYTSIMIHLIATGVAEVIGYLLFNHLWVEVLVTSFLCYLSEIAIGTYQVLKWERTEIHRILKGGAL